MLSCPPLTHTWRRRKLSGIRAYWNRHKKRRSVSLLLSLLLLQRECCLLDILTLSQVSWLSPFEKLSYCCSCYLFIFTPSSLPVMEWTGVNASIHHSHKTFWVKRMPYFSHTALKNGKRVCQTKGPGCFWKKNEGLPLVFWEHRLKWHFCLPSWSIRRPLPGKMNSAISCYIVMGRRQARRDESICRTGKCLAPCKRMVQIHLWKGRHVLSKGGCRNKLLWTFSVIGQLLITFGDIVQACA